MILIIKPGGRYAGSILSVGESKDLPADVEARLVASGHASYLGKSQQSTVTPEQIAAAISTAGVDKRLGAMGTGGAYADLPEADKGGWIEVTSTQTIGGVLFTKSEWWRCTVNGTPANTPANWIRIKPADPEPVGPRPTQYASASDSMIKPSDHGRTLVMPTNLVSWTATTDVANADALPDGFECNIRASGVGNRVFRANANNVYVLPPLSTSGNQVSIPEGETVRLEVIYNGAIRNIHIAQRITAPSVGISRIIKFLYNSGTPETYTPSPGAKTALMYITAGGGQGGGATATSTSNYCAGSGGGSGQTTIVRVPCLTVLLVLVCVAAVDLVGLEENVGHFL